MLDEEEGWWVVVGAALETELDVLVEVLELELDGGGEGVDCWEVLGGS